MLSTAIASYAFVKETTPYVQPQVDPPAVDIDAATLARWSDFPPYTGAIPVLTYHDISAQRGKYALTAETFTKHLKALRAAGFESVGLEQVQALVNGEPVDLPPRPLLITFDDGPASNWIHADPILEAEGFRAAAFIVTGSVAAKTPSYYLTWGQIGDMAKSGRWEFAVHTHSGHRNVAVGADRVAPWLTNLERSPARHESLDEWKARTQADLDTSLQTLESHVGRLPTRAMSYPFSAARYPTNDRRIPSLLESMVDERFDLAFTSGAASETGADAVQATSLRVRLPRLTVTSDLDADEILAEIRRMVPTPYPAHLDEVEWTGAGGTCEQADDRLNLAGDDYTACSPLANSSQWRNYTLQMDVVGISRAATAIIAVRESDNGRAEVAIGEGVAKVRQSVDGEWHELATLPLPKASAVNTPTSRHVQVGLDDRSLTLLVDGTASTQVMLDPSLTNGEFSFALAARGPQSIEVRDVVLAGPRNTSWLVGIGRKGSKDEQGK